MKEGDPRDGDILKTGIWSSTTREVRMFAAWWAACSAVDGVSFSIPRGSTMARGRVRRSARPPSARPSCASPTRRRLRPLRRHGDL
jgi:hypothetical protein